MFARRGDGWTDEQDEIIRRMHAAGATAFLVAARLRRSESAVKKRAWSLGLRFVSHQARRSQIKRADPSYNEHGQ